MLKRISDLKLRATVEKGSIDARLRRAMGWGK